MPEVTNPYLPGYDDDDETITPANLPKGANAKTYSRKGKPNNRAGTPRGRITERDSIYLAFAGLFPGADSEAFSILFYRDKSPLAPAGDFPSVKGAAGRLRKLEKFNAIERFRHGITGELLYGATTLGITYAKDYGHQMSGSSELNGISLERLNHYRMIAHTAAQLTSPGGFFQETLGLKPVELDHLITEKVMRSAFQPVKEMLNEQKKSGKSCDYGRYRNELLKQAANEIQSGKYTVSDLADVHPTLLTLGQPQREGGKLKAVYQPDLAVRGVTNDGKPLNLLVEVELTKKNWTEYDRILATLQKELTHSYIYSKAVYFTTHSGVEALLRKVDTAGDYGLFNSGKLQVLPILHRDGTPVASTRRVRVGVK